MRAGVLSVVALAVIGLSSSLATAADGLLGVTLVQRDGAVVIQGVIKGSGAEGVLLPGDVLYKVGATRINSIQDALDAKAAASNNTAIPFLIVRNGAFYDFNGRFEKGQLYGSYSKPAPRKK